MNKFKQLLHKYEIEVVVFYCGLAIGFLFGTAFGLSLR